MKKSFFNSMHSDFMDFNALEATLQRYQQQLATQQHPSPTLFLKVAESLHRLHRNNEAATTLRQGLTLHSQDATLWSYLARVQMARNEVQAAQQAYEKALAYNNHCLPALAGYGRLLSITGDLPQAITYFRAALTERLQQPTTAKAHPLRNDFNKPSREALLWKTLAQLAAADVHAFPTAGTLLGLEREGHLIPFDKDLDVGVPVQEVKAAQICLYANGWKSCNNHMRLSNPQAYYHKEEDVVLDVCAIAKEEESGKLISGFWRPNLPREWWRIIEYPSPLRFQKAEGPYGTYWRLENPHAVLEAFYGVDWSTPDPNFDTVVAAYNQRGFSLMTQSYTFYRLYGHWQEGRLTKALATTRHALRHLPNDALLVAIETHLVNALK